MLGTAWPLCESLVTRGVPPDGQDRDWAVVITQHGSRDRRAAPRDRGRRRVCALREGAGSRGSSCLQG